MEDVINQIYDQEPEPGPSKPVVSPGENISQLASASLEDEWAETVVHFWRDRVFINPFRRVSALHTFDQAVSTLGLGFPTLTIFSDILRKASGATVLNLFRKLKSLNSNQDVILFFSSIEILGSTLLYEISTVAAESRTKNDSLQKEPLHKSLDCAWPFTGVTAEKTGKFDDIVLIDDDLTYPIVGGETGDSDVVH